MKRHLGTHSTRVIEQRLQVETNDGEQMEVRVAGGIWLKEYGWQQDRYGTRGVFRKRFDHSECASGGRNMAGSGTGMERGEGKAVMSRGATRRLRKAINGIDV